MKWEDHRSWVLGSIAALGIAFGAAVFSVVYASYYNRTHQIAAWGALGTLLKTPVPLWFVFLLGVVAAWITWKAYPLWRHRRFFEARLKVDGIRHTVVGVLKQRNLRLEEQIAELKSKEPKLHAVWNNAQTFWHMGRQGDAPMMQIGGWIDLTSSNTTQLLYLLAAYIDDSRSQIFIEVEVKPNVVNRAMVMLYLVPPLSKDEDKPFTATIIVEDQFNRKYELPSHEFRATPGQTPLGLSNQTAVPLLHASWSGDAVWGWASSNFVDDGLRTYRGDVTLLMDNIKEPVTIKGVEIDGAESIGKFDNFSLYSGQPETRWMKLYFRGKAPKGNDYYTVRFVFIDLRGNRYPAPEHRFHPLPIAERVAIERGHN